MIQKINAPHIANTLGISIEDAIKLDNHLFTVKKINWTLHYGWYAHYAEEIGINVPPLTDDQV